MLTRRHFIITSATLFSGAVGLPAAAQDRVDFDRTVERPDPDPFANNPWGLHPRFMPTRVEHRAGLVPGDIHVDAVAKYLYHIGGDGTAMRYGVAIGRADLYESGIFRIGRKAEWPSWQPTQNMIEREPEVYGPFADGMPGGPENPLGARALYLYEGSRDTYLRIHGTPQPWSIGTSASSGCVRMVNAHIMEMYDRVEVGSTAHLYPPV
ncbi:L,D-transpeptidase [Roseicyclus sp.]|uniref:L,D-transpeptidase n=1 Tax=Roseicyclus sp. TaxID=1914329 RepID=UPI003FA11E50